MYSKFSAEANEALKCTNGHVSNVFKYKYKYLDLTF